MPWHILKYLGLGGYSAETVFHQIILNENQIMSTVAKHLKPRKAKGWTVYIFHFTNIRMAFKDL